MGSHRSVKDRDIYAPVLERAPGTESAVIALRAALSARAFAVVAAAAIVGGPTIALARWLAESYAWKLDESEWLYIATLPWFASGQWPEGLAERLGAALEMEDPELARSLRSLAQRLLAASEPLRDSAAHLQWQLDGARQAFLRGERAVAGDMLRRIAMTPFARQARTALTGFGLRDRRRTAMGAALALGALVVGGALGSGFLEHRSQALMMTARAAERHLVKLSGDGATLPRPSGTSWPESFAVKVVDGSGTPVSGARVVWTNPALGPRSFIGETDAMGISRAAQLYRAQAGDGVEQVAQLIDAWNGPPLVDAPVITDGEGVVFKFRQIQPKIKFKLSIELQPESANLDAKFFINDIQTSHTTDLEVSPNDKLDVKIVVPGYRDMHKQLDIGDDDDDTSMTLSVDLKGLALK